MMTHVISPAHI